MKTLDLTGLQGRDLAKFIADGLDWWPDIIKAPSDADSSWAKANPKFVMKDRRIPLDVYRKLSNYNFVIDGVVFVLAEVEAETYTESDRGYDGESVSSTYPRIAITYEPKAA